MAGQALPGDPRRAAAPARRRASGPSTGSPSRCAAGETLGLVGESGCGKSTTGRLLAGYLTRHLGPGHLRRAPTSPRLAGRTAGALRREIQMIFQDPYSSLNPRHTVGTIVGAPFRYQRDHAARRRSGARVQELLEQVGLSPEHYNRYPARVLRRPAPAHRHRPRARPVARSSSSPTSRCRRWTCPSRRRSSTCSSDLQRRAGLAYLFIAHDLSVVRHISRPRRGHVPRQDRRAGRRRAALRARRATRTRGRCCRRSRSPTPGVQQGAAPAGRRAAQPAGPAVRLPVPHPVLEGPGDLRDHRAALAGADARHQVACHFPEAS